MSATSFSKSPSTLALYIQVLAFSLVLFSLSFAYTSWMKIPNVLNKSVADTSIVLMGLSMILSSICYFWNFLDSFIKYRKYLGLVGWAFGLTHVVLSNSALQALFVIETWQKGLMWPALTGLIATIIFTIMALISNSFSAKILGGRTWKTVLRTGYVAVLLVLLHVVLLKSSRWISWYQDGLKTPPSLSLLVTVFMAIVILMRIALWISLKKKMSIK